MERLKKASIDSISDIPILCVCNLKSQKHIVRIVHGQFLTILIGVSGGWGEAQVSQAPP